MEKIMKNQIKISLAVLSALVISADSQAMFRARLVQPQMPRRAQRSLSYGKAQEILRMPNVQSAPQRALNLARNQNQMPQFSQTPQLANIPFTRLNGGLLGLQTRYKNLLAQKEEVASALYEIRDAAIGATFPFSIAIGYAIGTSEPALLLPGSLGAILAYNAVAKSLGISPFLAQERNLEADLDELVIDQKRQLRNPDHIQ